MAKSGVDWATDSWSPMSGCSHAGSPSCDACYARSMAIRFAGGKVFPNGFDVTLFPERLEQPLHWKKPRNVFVCPTGDLFHDDVPFEFIEQVVHHTQYARQHIYQFLTKRAERMAAFWCWFSNRNCIDPDSPDLPYPNVWLGVTAENQEMADERIPVLLQVPAAVHWVSIEPMLGPMMLENYFSYSDYCPGHDWGDPGYPPIECSFCEHHPGVDWIVVGGESGPKARPTNPNWVRSIRDQCQAVGAPFYMKQWGCWVSPDNYGFDIGAPDISLCKRHVFPDGQEVYRTGKKFAGHMLDGKEWRQFPGDVK